MKVAILTMFTGLIETYSVTNVVAEHLYMLLNDGIEVKLIVAESCMACERKGIYADERIEWVGISHTLNGRQIQLQNYDMPNGKLHATFAEEVDFFAKQFEEALQDVEVCIMHDTLYTGIQYVYNIAIRQAQENLDDVAFIAFAHSFPVNRPIQLNAGFEGRYTPMPRTRYVYPSSSGIPALAAQYNVARGKCQVVYNSPSLMEHVSEEVKEIHRQVNLLRSDVLIIYPGRLSEGKKFEKVAAFAGCLKVINEQTVQVVFCDVPDQRTKGYDYKKKIKKEGRLYGLDEGELVFTSELGYPMGIAHQSILDLFSLSNLFVCPSYSEGFSLTTLEAASRGNFLVLNECVPALEEAGQLLHAYFMKWDARNYGFDTKQNYHPSEKAYYEEHSKIVADLMRDDRVCYAKTVVRQRLNREWIWENQLKPLLEV
ncbi:MAG: glycosyltransferase [Cellulosilyticaceae bacterium]